MGEFLRLNMKDSGKRLEMCPEFLDHYSLQKIAQMRRVFCHTLCQSSQVEAGRLLSDAADPVRGKIPGSVNRLGSIGEGKSIGMTGDNETRPRNVAFNYIVRAA